MPSPQPSPQEAQILSQFADIILPPEVSIWPLTWQVWLILFLSLCILAAVCTFIIRLRCRVKKNAYRKLSLRLIHDVKKGMADETIKLERGLAKINEVIKSCLILAGYEKNTFMSLHGEPWYRYLISTASKNQQPKLSSFDSQFSSWGKVSYQDLAMPVDELEPFFEFASIWIKCHPHAKEEKKYKNKIEKTSLENDKTIPNQVAQDRTGEQKDV